MFAKLYGPDHDQVLVTFESKVDGSSHVRISFQPEGLPLCAVVTAFSPSPADQVEARRLFDNLTEPAARAFVSTRYFKPNWEQA